MLVPVYDIKNCGPRHRFVANGRLVHNSDGINLQNLPARGANAGKIKKAIRAPAGYVVIDCDSAQIEARVLAWLAGQTDMVRAFLNKEDVYSIMATKLYGRPVDRKRVEVGADGVEFNPDKTEGQVGKTVVLGCFGPDTVVLTQRGWVPIIQVLGTDTVWDGEEWVQHHGVVPQGEKEVLTTLGLSATADHEILTERGWAAWSGVLANLSHLRSALSLASLPASVGNCARMDPSGKASTVISPRCAARVGGKGSWIARISVGAELRAAMIALKRKLNALAPQHWGLRQFAQTQRTGSGYSQGLAQSSAAAPTPTTRSTLITEVVESGYIPRGLRSAWSSCNTSSGSTAGAHPNWSLTASTTIVDTFRAIFGLSVKAQTIPTEGAQPPEKLKPCVVSCDSLKQRMQTYDIAYAGPRNRYTVLTSEGPIIVHNCGYGVGHVKLQGFLKTQAGVVVSLEESKRIIDTYRNASHAIVAFWKRAGDALLALLAGQSMTVDAVGLIRAVPGVGLTLPSGLHIQYPQLRVRTDPETGKSEMVYTSKGLPVRIYGGKCLAADTQVLTPRGWVLITSVQSEDRVWDGVEWVKHSGLIYQGEKHTIIVDGVRMTPDHQVLTEKGWRSASSCEGLRRAEVRLPNGNAVCGVGRPPVAMGVSMPVRQQCSSGGHRHREVCETRGAPLMRVHGRDAHNDACHVQTPSVLGVAVHAGPMPTPHAPSMAQLWSSGYNGVRSMARFVRGILDRHGADVRTGADAGQAGQQRPLHPGELPVGVNGGAGREPQGGVVGGFSQSTCGNRHLAVDTRVSVASEPVYDLLNAGPRTRFMVRGHAEPFVVHNCVENICQAVARQVVAEQMLRVSKRYKVVLTVHDAVAIIAKEDEAREARLHLEECMSWVPKWATGLPLACESGVGASYGDC